MDNTVTTDDTPPTIQCIAIIHDSFCVYEEIWLVGVFMSNVAEHLLGWMRLVVVCLSAQIVFCTTAAFCCCFVLLVSVCEFSINRIAMMHGDK